MRIKLIAIGQRMPEWVNTGYREYAQRLRKPCQLELIELPLPKRQKHSDIQQLKKQESEQLQSHINPTDLTIALDAKGQAWNTLQLANHLRHWIDDNHTVNLLIGGPDGLDPSCINNAHGTWSLSNLTLPHPLVRVLIAEQIYRAWSILENHPYHR